MDICIHIYTIYSIYYVYIILECFSERNKVKETFNTQYYSLNICFISIKIKRQP